ncbi:hypothetical protein VOLCADRAFT_94570 [Volvox carteri f. nagariensis]|uniref:2Fe-2S ferredoxin-type domain-containing protein n=1 Tax=Volvox carteri f. nagariensis TaxID=3068 RepID=D8U551_VOLCA|nr:uncharacterized protein VOLCADRAFT_94570 [Volvox carteri f. nagariensis]EFJ45156.1 hypothetical protein VOLCADRAFT_94570 [Volvox carteri f. nagariensis]|eukprot:XP_002953832.1 hypothetical protein VOLCADRAFT_94570 [Volvox carteri f. nagariensis]
MEMNSLAASCYRSSAFHRCTNRRTLRRASLWQQRQQQQHQQPFAVVTPCSPEAAVSASVLNSPTSTPVASPAKSTDVVTVYFRQEGTSTQARPGEDFLEVASRCRADIPTGCLHGSCGVCEVELFKCGSDGREAGSPVVMRACVAKVPRGWGRVEVGMMSADTVWGQDGWDT